MKPSVFFWAMEGLLDVPISELVQMNWDFNIINRHTTAYSVCGVHRTSQVPNSGEYFNRLFDEYSIPTVILD